MDFLGRKLTMGEIEIYVNALGGISSWQCTDNEYTSKVLVELGYFNGEEYSDIGFILYDGTNTGDETNYRRNGLDHRWDWGDEDSNFSFVIQTDGTGLYYDFTGVPTGEKISAKDVYHCWKR
jgi:hypothetical protein